MKKEVSLKNFVEEQLLKILSVLTAVFLWFYVVNSEPVLVTQNLHVNIISPVGKAVDQISSKSVEVQVKGARAFLNEYEQGHSSLILDLKKEKKEKVQYILSRKNFNLPFGVELISVKPKRLNIRFDRLIKKEVPIILSKSGDLRKELEFSKEEVNPQRIMINGPVSAMRKVSTLETTEVNVEELYGSGELELGIKNIPNFINIEGDNKVSYKYSIRAKKANFNLKNIDVIFVSKDKNFKALSDKVSVDVFASENSELRKSDIKIFAEIPDNNRKSLKIRLRAELPEDVHLLQINPPFIEIKRD